MNRCDHERAVGKNCYRIHNHALNFDRENMKKSIRCNAIATLMFATAISIPASSQKISRLEREDALVMLETMASDLRTFYYDPNFHGVDLQAKVDEAKEKIRDAPSARVAYAEIESVLESLNDSHTFFVPPREVNQPDYGWKFRIVGNRCFVVDVDRGSDAEKKGLRRGDEVLAINGFQPTRESMWKMKYALETLLPQRELQVDVLNPDGTKRRLEIVTSIKQSKQVIDMGDMTGGDQWWQRIQNEKIWDSNRPRFAEFNQNLMIVRIPIFFLTDFQIDGLIDKARDHKHLIIDLRGNPGGSEASLLSLVGGIFDKDVKIADRVTRDTTTPIVVKRHPKHVFSGKLLVLVDSDTASAAEVFARIVQLENRGVVWGDVTAGHTMEGQFHPHKVGQNPVFLYAASITRANLVMPDGKSLERVGVAPDERIFPLGDDLATGRDPALASAAATFGVKLTPEAAGKLFPSN